MSGPMLAEEKRAMEHEKKFGLQMSPDEARVRGGTGKAGIPLAKPSRSPSNLSDSESRPGTAMDDPFGGSRSRPGSAAGDVGGVVAAATTGSKLASKVRGAATDNRAEDDPYTLIFSKVRHGHIEAVQKLLAQGVAVDGRDKFGNTPLMTAAQNGKYKVAKFLVKSGCNVNLQNGQGNSALHFCMAYGFKKLGEMLLKAGADATQRNRAGMTCYEGIDVKARAAGSEIAGPEHSVNTASDLAAIKVEEMNAEIKKLKEQVAEEENRRVIAVDQVQQDLTKVKAKADKGARELEKTVAELKVAKAAAAEGNAASANQVTEVKAKLETAEAKITELNGQLSGTTADLEAAAANAQAAAAAEQAELKAQQAALESQLQEAVSARDAALAKVEQHSMTNQMIEEQMAEMQAKAGEGQAMGDAQKNKLAEMTNKWSAEVMERKKFEDNLKLKVSICDRLDKELEVLRPAHEQLTAEHTETCSKLEARVVELTAVHSQLGEIETERATLTAQLTDVTSQLAGTTANLEAAAEAKASAEAQAAAATGGADAAQKQLQADCDKAKQAEALTKDKLNQVTAKLKAVEENELKLMAEVTKAKKAAADGAAGASAAADDQLAELRAASEAEKGELKKANAKTESKLRLAEQELISCRSLISEEQAKAAAAGKAGESVKAEMDALMTNADARAKMLQSCVDSEKERCTELETRLAQEVEKSSAAAAVEKQNGELKAELDETKAKLATLWSQFLGGK